jgi:hypothetical protein
MSRSNSSKSTLIHVAPVHPEDGDFEVLSMGEVEDEAQERAVQFAGENLTVFSNPRPAGERACHAGILTRGRGWGEAC